MKRPTDDLHALGSVLARTRPELDEATDARVQARLDAMLAASASGKWSRSVNRLSIAFGGAVALTAVVVALWHRAPAEPPPPAEAPRAPALALSTIDRANLRATALTWLRETLAAEAPSVRSQAAAALAELGDQQAIAPLQKMAASDPDGGARVAASAALMALGDASAAGRLLELARSSQLTAAYQAALTLAALAQPSDASALLRLQPYLSAETPLLQFEPRGEAELLTALTRLRDPISRKRLLKLLESPEPDRQLAAAEGLASLGNDAGAKILERAAGEPPHRLAAVIALRSLGRSGIPDFLSKQLSARDPEARRRAARALGALGEIESLPVLLQLASREGDGAVRGAAAASIISLLELDPELLSASSLRWTRQAAASSEMAIRQAAASSLGDLPDQTAALELLGRALVDAEPAVRSATARSAVRLGSSAAASALATALANETDPAVKEQQVTRLAQLGRAEARAILTELSASAGNLGTLAAGALLATGDGSQRAQLDRALASPDAELRLAAVRALALAPGPATAASLERALADRVFSVRFAAAVALAPLRGGLPRVLQIIDAGLQSKNLDQLTAALAALAGARERRADWLLSTQRMINSASSSTRLAAVSVIGAMPSDAAVPLLRQLLVDPDRQVRRAAVDAIADLEVMPQSEMWALYRSRSYDPDPAIRARVAGRLARLVPTPRVDAAR